MGIHPRVDGTFISIRARQQESPDQGVLKREPMRYLNLLTIMLWMSAVSATQADLAEARSPYLRKHADSPIQWRQWGDAAFQEARAEDRPIFLSIGYLTCRGCQVMKQETFSQPEVIEFLNAHFIPILLDREERPDVDRVYQAFVAGTTGRGGWPLNVWMTPTLEPFLGGTYFPPVDRPGMPSLLSTARIANRGWREDRSNVVARAETLRRALETMAAATGDAETGFRGEDFMAAARELIAEHDPEYGGFGRDAKFPHAAKIHFLLRFAERADAAPALRAEARSVAFDALEAIVSASLRDHERGGFHRYTTDREWQKPHFEKMLYDQAAILDVLVDAFLLTQESRWREAIVNAVGFVQAELTRGDGAFASSFNAVNTGEDGVPLLDDKMVTAWNGSMIAALARAAVVLDRPEWLTAAIEAAERVRTLAMDAERGVTRLDSGQLGFAEDTASLIHAWLTLFETTFEPHWLQEAEALQAQMEEFFGDPEGGYFSTRADTDDVLIRMKEDFDGEEPSPNSLTARNLRRLYSLTGNPEYARRLDPLFQHFAGRPFTQPAAMPILLAEAMMRDRPALQIVIAGDAEAEDTQAMLREVRQRFLPEAVVARVDPEQPTAGLPAYMRDMQPLEGRATAYVCESFVCRLPVNELEDLIDLLDAVRSEIHEHSDKAATETGIDDR